MTSTRQTVVHREEPLLGGSIVHREDGAFLRELLQTQEEERTRIARELHDGVGQMLALLRNYLNTLSRSSQEPVEAQQSYREASERVQLILDEVRRITLELMPAILEDLGLDAAIRSLIHDCHSHHIRITADMPALNGLLPAEHHIHFYRILQEAFSNILRHSGASAAAVRIRQEHGLLECTIADNGMGFLQGPGHGNGTGGHCGLHNMQARGKLLGGTVSVESEPEHGTTVRIVVPLRETYRPCCLGPNTGMFNTPAVS